MIDLSLVPVAHPQVASRVVDEQAVIVLSDEGEVTVLNEVGTRVWDLVDGKRTVGQIIDLIASEYAIDQETARRDVEEFLKQLVDAKAIIFA